MKPFPLMVWYLDLEHKYFKSWYCVWLMKAFGRAPKLKKYFCNAPLIDLTLYLIVPVLMLVDVTYTHPEWHLHLLCIPVMLELTVYLRWVAITQEIAYFYFIQMEEDFTPKG